MESNVKSNFDSLFKRAYFIADIAANHDGSLERALNLIKLAAESGADAAKFQNFKAETIVSSRGFQELGKKLTHQSKWEKDVVDVYREASLPLDWTNELIRACKQNGIDYFTAPYDLDLISEFASKMPFFKVGSGDITWKESLETIASHGKPILLATGASDLWEVERAMETISKFGNQVVLMQCNTNYTGEQANFDYINLRVLEFFKSKYPDVILGLSDHSQGHLAVLGAVALGAKAIEKHFTDDTSRVGPDHAFSLDPKSWSLMVSETRTLERCLGDGVKRVEENEIESRIVQRRALRYKSELKSGHVIKSKDLIALRPCPANGIDPYDLDEIVGKTLMTDVKFDQLVSRDDIKNT
jgi:sialic acid synthase SpsE